MVDFIDWLASYPKSGNTYVRAFLNAYLYGDKFHLNNMDAVTSEPKIFAYASLWHNTEPYDLYDWACMRHIALRNWFESNRVQEHFVLKTHTVNGAFHDMPMISKVYTRKAVYITRDPRDVLVSAAKYFRNTVEKQWEIMKDDEHLLGKWDHKLTFQPCSSWRMNVVSWLTNPQFPVLHIKYEDLLKYPREQFKGILEFYDIDVDEQRIHDAVERTSFENLQKAEQKHGFNDNLPMTENEQKGEAHPFFRKGTSGQWKTELDPKLADAVYQEYRDIEHLWRS